MYVQKEQCRSHQLILTHWCSLGIYPGSTVIHHNDLPNVLCHRNETMFADNTNIWKSAYNTIKGMNEDANNL